MLQVRKAAKPLTSSVAVAFTPKVWFNDFRTPILAEYLVDLEVRVTDYTDDHVAASDASKAPLADPHFTGTPTAPTATAGDDSTTLATTAFVSHAVSVGGGGGGGGGGTWKAPVISAVELPPTPVEFLGTGLPLAIPDDVASPKQEIPIVVTGGVNVETVRVKLQVDHTFVGDLQLYLKHPDGTQITLVSNHGGSSDNIGTPGSDPPDAGFADDGISDIGYFTGSPIVGVFAPADPLSTFTGKPVAGTWKLLADDNSSGDTGTINDVRLLFSNIITSSTNGAGDARVTLDNDDVYVWGSDSAWHKVAGPDQPLVWANIADVGTLSSGWSSTTMFSDTAAPSWAYAGIAKDPSGVVHMRGMLTKASALALPETIAQLPVGFRPAFRKRFTIPAYDLSVGHSFLLLVDIQSATDSPSQGMISLRTVLPSGDSAASGTTAPQLTFDGITFET